MSTFQEHKTSADRSASDRRRHKQKIEKAIKEGIHSIVAEESIIGQSGGKKVRIPVRGIKEHRLVYGSNTSKKVGAAGDIPIKRGQQLTKKNKGQGQGQGEKAGNKKGEEFYEVEITLDELAEYLFKDLQLPDMEVKKVKKIFSEKFKRKGYRTHGIRPRLSKKETLKRKLKRKQAARRVGHLENEDEFSFHESDLKYKHIAKTYKETSNAVMFFMMDVSGSMSKNKKYLARSFFFLLYHFIRFKYENVDLIFLAHDTQAYEVNEDKFFHRGSSGGTIVSSVYEKASEIINERYHPDSWNIYMFHCSDGDNWRSDNHKTIAMISLMKEICQIVGYCEISDKADDDSWFIDKNKLANVLDEIEDKKFKIAIINSKEDVWEAFKSFVKVGKGHDVEFK